MGVDARIIVKVKPPHLTPKEVSMLSYECAQAFGFEQFRIYPDMRPVEELPAVTADHQDAEYYPHTVGHVTYFQDGDPIVAEDDEQFLQVNVYTRYFAPGYERGDALLLFNLAAWLELQFTHFDEGTCRAEIWYGGDSSGCVAELFDLTTRNKMMMYEQAWAKVSNVYHGEKNTRYPKCDFCSTHVTYRMGDNYDITNEQFFSWRKALFYRCAGCGRQAIKHCITGEVTYVHRRETLDQALNRVADLVPRNINEWLNE